MLRLNANYDFGLPFVMFLQLNADLTLATPDRIVGGIGPFDFSGVANIAAVPFTTKIDAETELTVNLDLSGAVDPAAVTVTELFNAINTAAPVDIVASMDANNRLFVEYNGTENPEFLQVYGAAALLGQIGQGLGVKFIKSDTIRTFTDTPIQKDEETIPTTDAQGLDTEILTDGYRKGISVVIADTVGSDWEMKQLIEGGVYDETAGTYEVPTSEDNKVYFSMYAFFAQYTRGTNKEGEQIGYIRAFYKSCKGVVGDGTHERNWSDGNFTVTGTSYKDESDVISGDTIFLEYTVEEYDALDVYNL